MDGLHLHAQSLAHAFGDFWSREWLIQRVECRVYGRVQDAIGHALPPSPADPLFSTPGGTPNEDRQLLGRHQEQRATHARSLDQEPFAESFFYMGSL